MTQRVERTFAGRKLVVETGRMAKQAAGSAVVQFGDSPQIEIPFQLIRQFDFMS